MEINIPEILKVGFSGLAFLLALFSYHLLLTEQKRVEPREGQLNAISRFMVFSIILGLITVLIPFLPKVLENKPDPYMEAMLQYSINRKPLPVEFVQNQIGELTSSHDKRIDTLYIQRVEHEAKLSNSNNTDSDIRKIESGIRRIEQFIRQENSDYNRKVSNFRNML